MERRPSSPGSVPPELHLANAAAPFPVPVVLKLYKPPISAAAHAAHAAAAATVATGTDPKSAPNNRLLLQVRRPSVSSTATAGPSSRSSRAPSLMGLSSPATSSATAGAATAPSAAVTTTGAGATAPPKDSAASRFASLHADAKAAKAWCLRLHAEFLAKSAMYEINIPDDLSALVSSQIAQLRSYEPTPLDATGIPRFELTETEEPQPPPFALSLLFAQTQLAILDLVETDSFRRFILTAEFRALIAAADEAEAARREMQADLQGHMAAVISHAVDTMAGGTLAGGGQAQAASAAMKALDESVAAGSSSRNSGAKLLPGEADRDQADMDD